MMAPLFRPIHLVSPVIMSSVPVRIHLGSLHTVCHHVCQGNADIEIDRGEAIMVSWPKHPLVDQPSPADSQQLIVKLVKEKLFQEACMARPTTGSVFGPKSIPTDRAAINLAIVQANERLATAQTFQTHFGSVMCTSGLRTVTPFEDGPLSYLDWGLVKVDDSRLPSDAPVTNVSETIPTPLLFFPNLFPVHLLPTWPNATNKIVQIRPQLQMSVRYCFMRRRSISTRTTMATSTSTRSAVPPASRSADWPALSVLFDGTSASTRPAH